MSNADELSREDMLFLTELFVTNQKHIEELLKFLRFPPAIGSITLRMRDGKLVCTERVEQTY